MIILIAFVILFSLATLYAGDSKVLFDQYCRACHGEGGVSHSRSFPSLKSTNMPAAQIKAVIRNGLNSGSGYRTSGFSVESYQDILAGTSFSSTLMMLIEHKVDSSIHMPFRKEKLPQQKIDILRKWIDQGAKNN